MKQQDIKTYSRYYPSLLFERTDGEDVHVARLQLVEKLKASFPEAEITSYRTYGKLSTDQNDAKRILNIVIMPSEAKRQNVDGGIAERADFDILAHRIQITSRYVRVSCWQVSSHTKMLDCTFYDGRLKTLWQETKDHLNYLQDDYVPLSCMWMDYLRAVEAMAGIFPAINEILGLVVMDNNYSVSFFNKPLDFLFAPDYATSERIQNIGQIIQSLIVENENQYKLTPVSEAYYHTHLLSRYPISVADYLSRNDQYLSFVNNTDEAIALLVANVHLAFVGFEENKKLANTKYGFSISSLLHSLFFSHIDNDVVEVELIASLWKSIDDNSLIYTYESSEWENVTYYSSFFRQGNRLHPMLRFITLALAIHDTWLRHRLEESIPADDLDQLLALLSIPESYLSILNGTIDSEIIDIPNTTLVTLIGGTSTRYNPAQNILVRLSIFETSKSENSTFYMAKECELARLLRSMSYYKSITDDVTKVFLLYITTKWAPYNPLLNNVFVFARDRKMDYLKLWQERVKAYFSTEENDAVALHLTRDILRISMMTSYIEKQQVEELITSNDNGETKELYTQLLALLPTEKQISCGLIATVLAHYWLLYFNLYVENDVQEAEDIFQSLKGLREDRLYSSVKSYFRLDNTLTDSNFHTTQSEESRLSLRHYLIDVLTNHIAI